MLEITSLEKDFYSQMNNLIRNEVNLSEWQMILGVKMDADDMFNRQGLVYNE